MTILTDNERHLPQLSARMTAIAKMVRSGEITADIGCDHGYISIWLYKTGISPRCIASDINEGPVSIAERNIRSYGASEGIVTRTGGGLSVLESGEADTAIIAGMGGKNVADILKDDLSLAKELNLVLSPQSEVSEVRSFLADNFFRIEEEDFVKEDDKYYTVMRAAYTGRAQTYDDAELMFGPCLLKKKNELLEEFILKRKDWLQNMISVLESNSSRNAVSRRHEMEQELEIVNRALEYYE